MHRHQSNPKMRLTSYLCVLALALSTLLFTSCQKEPTMPETQPRLGPDSTLLVKSIERVYYDQNGNPSDSATESYSYDTVNKKIKLTWTGSDYWAGSAAEYTYSSDDLLTDIKFSYDNTWVPWSTDYTDIKIEYNNDNIVKRVTLNYRSEPQMIRNYVKTNLPNGYRLDWNSRRDVNDSSTFYNIFNTDKICTKYSSEVILTDPVNGIYGHGFQIDSLVYNTSGNLSHVYRKMIDSLNHTSESFLKYEFDSRESKGSELSDQRRLLFNGVDNLRFNEADDWFWISILGDVLDAYDYDQYSGVPIKSAKVYNTDADLIVPYTAASVFDSKGRLVEFKGFVDDGPLIKLVYKVVYYK